MRTCFHAARAQETAPPPIRSTAELCAALGAPCLPVEIRFALLERPGHRATLPVAYPSLQDLARGIHRRRAGLGLQLVDQALWFHDEPAPRPGVSVFRLDGDGDRQTFLGWAWLAGAGLRALSAALLDAQPQRVGG